MDFFHLRCGRRVSLEGFHMGRTYAGWLEGIPRPEHNDEIVAGATKWLKALWGRSESTVIPPIRTPVTAGEFKQPSLRRRFELWAGCERLPSLQCAAWLESGPLDPKSCGSSAFVAFWQPQGSLRLPVANQVIEAVGDRRWEEIAHDFDV